VAQGKRPSFPFRRTRNADKESLDAGRLRITGASGGNEGLSGSIARSGKCSPTASRCGRAGSASMALDSVRRTTFMREDDGDKRIVIRGLSILCPSHPVPLLRCVCNRVGG